ncbi:MAG: AtpZ/AtpI family protein [Pseudomonadota bacterium]
MEALEARLESAKARSKPENARGEEHYSMANVAWRMVIELVAGIVIGFCIGIGLDSLFGTTPIFLVVFILFGLAAGINVMLRTAKEVEAKQAASREVQAAEENADG